MPKHISKTRPMNTHKLQKRASEMMTSLVTDALIHRKQHPFLTKLAVINRVLTH